MTDANKTILKRIGTTAGILAGIYVLVSLFRGWNPMKWFEPATPKEGDDCKMNDGRDGKINASGSCVAPSGAGRTGISEAERMRRQKMQADNPSGRYGCVGAGYGYYTNGNCKPGETWGNY